MVTLTLYRLLEVYLSKSLLQTSIKVSFGDNKVKIDEHTENKSLKPSVNENVQ